VKSQSVPPTGTWVNGSGSEQWKLGNDGKIYYKKSSGASPEKLVGSGNCLWYDSSENYVNVIKNNKKYKRRINTQWIKVDPMMSHVCGQKQAQNLNQLKHGARGYLYDFNNCGVQWSSSKVRKNENRYQAKVDCGGSADLIWRSGNKIYTKIGSQTCGLLWTTYREPAGSPHDVEAVWDCDGKADTLQISTTKIKSQHNKTTYGLEWGAWNKGHGVGSNERILKWDGRGGADPFYFVKTN
tara:strand:- start:1186 stop:1905 length:720 start_codon:yes stop_codon:yes gene_type:complete